MKKKLMYLSIVTAFGVSLSSCNSGSDAQGASSSHNSLSSALGIGICGLTSSPKSITIEDVQTIIKGSSKGLSAHLTCSNDEVVDITSDSNTNWSSSDYDILNVDNKNYKGKVTGVEVGNATLKVTYSGLTTTKPVSVVNSYCGKSAQMIGTHVEPAQLSSIPVGGEAELHLYADCSNDMHPDITNYATWQSSSKLTIDINNDTHKGLITGKQKGSANISALLDGEKVYDHRINVDSALLKSLDISGSSTIAKGLTSQLKVIGVYSDGDNVDVTKIAKYSVVYGNIAIDESGVISAKDEGEFKVQVTLDGKFGYLEGYVTPAKLLKFTLDNPNIVFTPYLNTNTSITAKAHYSDGKVISIPSSGLNCEMEGNQTNIIQNLTGGCTFSQLGEVNSSVNVKVTYPEDFGLPEQSAKISVSLAPLKSIKLQAPTGTFILGNRIKYKVNLILADNSVVDVTKSLLLTLENNSRVKQAFSPTTPILFDNAAEEIIFNQPISPVSSYKLVAKIGNLESSVEYNDVRTNEITRQQLNEKILSAFNSEIINKIRSGEWYAIRYNKTDSKSEKNDDITKLITSLSSNSTLSINDLSPKDYERSSNIYNSAIDYDQNDPDYKITARLERNPSNRSSQVILSEFCNNTPVTQTFSTASISIATTEGFSWGFAEKIGLDVAIKEGINFGAFKGEITTTAKSEFNSNQAWNKQTTETISLGGATATVPPRKHAIVISTLHNTDYYYDGKLPLKLNGAFPVIFRIVDHKNHVKAIGVVDLASIYKKGKDTYLDKFFELSNNKLYLDLSPQLSSSGGENNKTITHSIYFVDDNATGQLPCIYPNGVQGGKGLQGGKAGNSLNKVYYSSDLPSLSHDKGFEFLNRKPDLITTQY